MTASEPNQLLNAFVFGLGRTVRQRLAEHLTAFVSGLRGEVVCCAQATSISARLPDTLRGRKIGVLVTDGFDSTLLHSLKRKAETERATVVVVAARKGAVHDRQGARVEADTGLTESPSTLFDSVAVLTSRTGAEELAGAESAVGWLSDAYAHLKVIGHASESRWLLDKAGIGTGPGILALGGDKALGAYIDTAKKGRVWKRENALRLPV